ncbi:MAG TPA: HEAT repeat domain-containing protein [Longimicrobiales bacterium]
MMKRVLVAAAAAITPMLAGVSAQAQVRAAGSDFYFAFAHPDALPQFRMTALPPEPWSQQDPAVALYRQGRAELNDHKYDRAAETFARIVERYPKSTYAPDAYYWQAFARYQAGDYDQARAVLREQQRRYPKAATAGDGRSLLARIQAAQARSGNSDAAASVATAAKASVQGCPKDDDDEDIRITALNSVLTMNAERAIPLLKQVLAKRDECSAALRRKAVFLVSQKRGADTEDILLSAARNDPDKEVRSQAVFWLSQVNSDRAVGYLEDILRSATDNEVRDKAIFALSQHRGERASQAIRSFAENAANPHELREKAVFWIGQRHEPDNAAFLKTLYGREPNQEIKDKILFSLSQQRGNEAWLMDVAMKEGENIEMRKKALFWAGQSRNTSIADLNNLYDRISNREMKDQLIFVYSQRREPQAVDRLMAIAKSESDRELRKKAIFWLSQSKDPRVAEFLMQLVNQ